MSKVNIRGLVKSLPPMSVYTPIIEGVVNAIQAVGEKTGSNGEVTLIVKRSNQTSADRAIPAITGVEIHDNGIGFTPANRTSFDTLYGEQKISEGGKGFGRVTFLKFFNSAHIESVYKDNGKNYKRQFDFTGSNPDEIIENEINNESRTESTGSIVYLNNLNEKYSGAFEKQLDTVARQLVERLLIYFIDDEFICPKITLKEEDASEAIVLNDFFKESDTIQKVAEDSFELSKDGKTEAFKLKTYKIYYTRANSTINLCAHSRVVTTEPLSDYIPEFYGNFFDPDNGEKNFVIKAYVLGNYLNENVSMERETFNFPRIQSAEEINMLFPFTQKDIEIKTAELVASQFKDELSSRREKRMQRVQNFVDQEAPWYKTIAKELDLAKLPHFSENISLETELHKLRYRKEIEVKKEAQELLDDPSGEDREDKIREVTERLTEVAKADLAHYVVSRRVVLDLFKDSLTWDDNEKYEKEQAVHDIIFPMRTDSDTTPYNEHNLWIIDERLSFTEYVASDQPLNPKDKRPDLLIFNNPIAYREGEELSNPITIFEFKRPQRVGYTDDENPIKQVGEYIKKIRSGDMKTIKGRNINANFNTPAYCFVVCDLTPKIRGFCEEYDLTKSPDDKAYFGYHRHYDMYVEVVSFDKVAKDAELRNRIFFKKLGIE